MTSARADPSRDAVSSACRVADYLRTTLCRLNKRKSYTKKWAPTNEALKAIINTLAQRDPDLLKVFDYHQVDLIKVACEVYWMQRRQKQIQEASIRLKKLKAAAKKRQQRLKKASMSNQNQPATKKEIRRFLAGYDLRHEVA